MTTKKINPKIITQNECVKIEADTTLYFKIDYKTNRIALYSPNGTSSSYFDPLMTEMDIENHEKFLRTYSVGIEYCKKMLKNYGQKNVTK